MNAIDFSKLRSKLWVLGFTQTDAVLFLTWLAKALSIPHHIPKFKRSSGKDHQVLLQK